MKILLCNWHMAIKTYLIIFFHLLLKNLTSQSKCFEKRRFCEFIQKATNRIFSFLHFYEGYIPRYQYRKVSNLGILSWNFSHFGPPCSTLLAWLAWRENWATWQMECHFQMPITQDKGFQSGNFVFNKIRIR